MRDWWQSQTSFEVVHSNSLNFTNLTALSDLHIPICQRILLKLSIYFMSQKSKQPKTCNQECPRRKSPRFQVFISST
jgi:hypothetical protein